MSPMGESFVSGAILAMGLATALVSACAGSALPPADPPSTPPPLVTPPSPSPPPSTVGETTPAPAPPAAADPDPPLDDPNESASPIPLVLQFDRTKGRSSFPKRTKPDSECWAGLPATGEHAKDYAAITLACGAPTGLVEYAKPVEGTLHHKHDQADVFTMPVLAGYCYRYFAIADSSIADLDLLIEKKGGSSSATIRRTAPSPSSIPRRPGARTRTRAWSSTSRSMGPERGATPLASGRGRRGDAANPGSVTFSVL